MRIDMHDSDDTKKAPSSNERRPYSAPAVSWEEAYEVKANLASACEKIGGSGGQCDTTPAS